MNGANVAVIRNNVTDFGVEPNVYDEDAILVVDYLQQQLLLLRDPCKKMIWGVSTSSKNWTLGEGIPFVGQGSGARVGVPCFDPTREGPYNSETTRRSEFVKVGLPFVGERNLSSVSVYAHFTCGQVGDVDVFSKRRRKFLVQVLRR